LGGRYLVGDPNINVENIMSKTLAGVWGGFTRRSLWEKAYTCDGASHLGEYTQTKPFGRVLGNVQIQAGTL